MHDRIDHLLFVQNWVLLSETNCQSIKRILLLKLYLSWVLTHYTKCSYEKHLVVGFSVEEQQHCCFWQSEINAHGTIDKIIKGKENSWASWLLIQQPSISWLNSKNIRKSLIKLYIDYTHKQTTQYYIQSNWSYYKFL